jgi:hypothetical protein
MKKYLSFGGGVNSVALHLWLLDQGEEFESVFVHHGTDWPETYDYVAGFQWWLKRNGHRPITILQPNVQGYANLYNYYFDRGLSPSFRHRSCSQKFKSRTLLQYFQKPCFSLIGIDADEEKRARISTHRGVEQRYPLVEYGIGREACKAIIKSRGLPVPMKSGCFMCVYQKPVEWWRLRHEHPDLVCKAKAMEQRQIERRELEGKTKIYLSAYKKPIDVLTNENQRPIFDIDKHPPCQCGL